MVPHRCRRSFTPVNDSPHPPFPCPRVQSVVSIVHRICSPAAVLTCRDELNSSPSAGGIHQTYRNRKLSTAAKALSRRPSCTRSFHVLYKVYLSPLCIEVCELLKTFEFHDVAVSLRPHRRFITNFRSTLHCNKLDSTGISLSESSTGSARCLNHRSTITHAAQARTDHACAPQSMFREMSTCKYDLQPTHSCCPNNHVALNIENIVINKAPPLISAFIAQP